MTARMHGAGAHDSHAIAGDLGGPQGLAEGEAWHLCSLFVAPKNLPL